LFAVELETFGGIEDADDKLIAAWFQGIGDVEGKRRVATGVIADFRAVDPDGGLVIDGFEIQQRAFAWDWLDPGVRADTRAIDRVRAIDPRRRGRLPVRRGRGFYRPIFPEWRRPWAGWNSPRGR
jgi:hypothetical protein